MKPDLQEDIMKNSDFLWNSIRMLSSVIFSWDRLYSISQFIYNEFLNISSIHRSLKSNFMNIFVPTTQMLTIFLHICFQFFLLLKQNISEKVKFPMFCSSFISLSPSPEQTVVCIYSIHIFKYLLCMHLPINNIHLNK